LQKIPQKLKNFGAQKIYDFLVFLRPRNFEFLGLANHCTKTQFIQHSREINSDLTEIPYRNFPKISTLRFGNFVKSHILCATRLCL